MLVVIHYSTLLFLSFDFIGRILSMFVVIHYSTLLSFSLGSIHCKTFLNDYSWLCESSHEMRSNIWNVKRT